MLPSTAHVPGLGFSVLHDLAPRSLPTLGCISGMRSRQKPQVLEASQGDVMVHPLAPVFILRGVPFSALAAETL